MGKKSLSPAACVLWDDLELSVSPSDKVYDPKFKKMWGRAFKEAVDEASLEEWGSSFAALPELESFGLVRMPSPEETYEGEPEWVWVACIPETGYVC